MQTELTVTLDPIYTTQAADQAAALHGYLGGHADLIRGQVSPPYVDDRGLITVYMTVAGEDVLDALIKGMRVLRLAFTELRLLQMFTSDIAIDTEV